jgi:hypothetical protein
MASPLPLLRRGPRTGLTYTEEEQADMRLSIVVMLSCVARHCEDPVFSADAVIQLCNPVFAKERQ